MKLRNNPEKLYACFKEGSDNIQALKQLGELSDFTVANNSSSGSGGGIVGGAEDTVQPMMTYPVVRHKSCRNAIDNQKVARARNKHKELISPVKNMTHDQ